MPKIISASRRTDIPAFYGDWFMSRIRDGFCGVVNPYGGAKHTVSLRPRDVSAIVFWSKNYAPFMRCLDELDNTGYKFYFHFSITGYGEIFEPEVPAWMDSVDVAHELAKRYSTGHVLWRFDPVVLSSATPGEKIIENFTAIADALEGAVRRCYFSFACHYGKVLRNFGEMHRESDVRFRAGAGEEARIADAYAGADDAFVFDLEGIEKAEIAHEMAAIAAARGISMHTCCGDYLVRDSEPAIHKAHCIDGGLISELFGTDAGFKPRPTREECGCFESMDIGGYDTCPHGCVYCYANANPRVAIKKHAELALDPHAFALKAGSRKDEYPAGEPDDGQQQLEITR